MTASEDIPSLESLAERAKVGDDDAKTALLARLYPVVRKHVGFVLGFDPSTDDAVQESMVQIYRALPRFRGESSPSTWALKIATRTARRYWRREARHREVPADLVLDPTMYEESTTHSAQVHLLVKALRRISEQKREAFVLMAIFQLSAVDAAKALGTNANTAASRYRHARAELERIYKNVDGD